jgi:hypothetical protein
MSALTQYLIWKSWLAISVSWMGTDYIKEHVQSRRRRNLDVHVDRTLYMICILDMMLRRFLLIWKDGIWSISRGFVISWQRCPCSGGQHMNSIRMYGKCRDWYGMCTVWAMIWCNVYRLSIYPLVPSIIFFQGRNVFPGASQKIPLLIHLSLGNRTIAFVIA